MADISIRGSQIGHNTQDVAEMVKQAARKTVCHFSDDAPEARDLMLMLGIYPGQYIDDGENGIPHTPPRILNPLNQMRKSS